MATRMNMLKLLQEVSGFADFAQPRLQPRQPGAVLIQLRTKFKSITESRKRIIRVDMQTAPDIPHPVVIRHLGGHTSVTGAR